MFETIIVSNHEAIACITLNRPEKFNSFNEQLHTELATALQSIVDDKSIRALIITGAGRGFCAGQDLSDTALNTSEGPADLGAALERNYNPLIRKISALEIPVVCALNGVAAGAGASLAMVCDFVVAADNASFNMAFCAVGLMPDSGASWHMIRHIGIARTKALAMLGSTLSAQKALEWGLIWQVTTPQDLMREASVLAKELAAKPPLAIAATKALINTSFDKSLHQQLEEERVTMQRLGYSDDFKEGVTAFMQKRAGIFKGK